MMKNVFVLIALTFVVGFGYAQVAKMNGAYQYLESYEDYIRDYAKSKSEKTLEKAKNSLVSAQTDIDAVVKDGSTSGNFRAHYYRGLIYKKMSLDKYNGFDRASSVETAMNAFKKAIELDEKKKRTTQSIDNINKLGGASYNAGINKYNEKDWAGAYAAMNSYLEIQEFVNQYQDEPKFDSNAWLVKGVAAQKLDKTDEAMKIYETMIDNGTEDPVIFQSLSGMYRNADNTDKALEIIEKGRKLMPDNEALMIEELNIYLGQGRSEEAIAKLEEAAAANPDNAELHFAMGTALEKVGKAEAAEKAYKSALAVKPDYFDAQYNLGALHYNKAVELTKQMNELPLDATSKYDMLKADRLAKFKVALPFFEQALKTNPESKNSMIALKEIYAKMDMLDKAGEITKMLNGLK